MSDEWLKAASPPLPHLPHRLPLPSVGVGGAGRRFLALFQLSQTAPTATPTVTATPGAVGGDNGAAFVIDFSGAAWQAFELFLHVPPSDADSVDTSACGALLTRTHAALAKGCDFRPEYGIPVASFYNAEYFVRKLEEEGEGLLSAEGRHLAKDLAAIFGSLPPPPEDDAPQIIQSDPKLANMLFLPVGAGGGSEAPHTD